MGKTQSKPLAERHSLFGPCYWSEHRPFRVTSGSSACQFDSLIPRLLGQHFSCCYASTQRIWRRRWRVLLVAFAKLWKTTITFFMSVCLSVRPSGWNNSAPTARIFMKFDISILFESMSIKFGFHLNLTRITGTLHEDQYAFLIIFRSVLRRLRNVSDKCCRRNQNTFHRQ
jgi:hypothetical protein